MRLNKFISETGACSRREADKWIEAGRVTLNGARATLGTQVVDGDVVAVDGVQVGAKKTEIYIALNKPVGIISTTEEQVEDNIIHFVGHPERIFPIGRLDRDSEGLILLTNHGDIVNEILRSENNHEKEYLVAVNRAITDLSLSMLARGVKIMGEVTKPCRVSRMDETSFRMVLTQGLNRQIRRMCSALGYRVTRLKRVRIMNIELGRLKAGEWRYLTPAEITGLKGPSRGKEPSASASPRREDPRTTADSPRFASSDSARGARASGKNHRPGSSSRRG